MSGQTTGCVLFADVSGSTKLYEQVGDSAAHAAIDGCVKLFSSVTEQHGGRVIKTIGDEVMSIFPSASVAGKAAVEMQLAVHAMPPVGKLRLGVRIGLQPGPWSSATATSSATPSTSPRASRRWPRAARSSPRSRPSSSSSRCQKMDCRSLYAIPVKGKERGSGAVRGALVGHRRRDQLVAQRTTTVAGRQLRIVYHGQTILVSDERRTLVLGRDAANADLVVPDRMASRTHCEIERRQGKFVVTDRSANGTYITIDGDTELVLRREEAMLRHHGVIALGQSRNTATELVEFFCE